MFIELVLDLHKDHVKVEISGESVVRTLDFGMLAL
jgi:hypothetical protein